MPAAPTFFVPAANPRTQEEVYTEFARWSGRTVAPPPEKRIYSITFSHDGDVWQATVGECLRGTRTTVHRVRGEKTERTQALSDPAMVLAIFPGVPYIVVTDHRLAGATGSRWENPFYTGTPQAITYFSVPE